jgi:hypothetical protein
MAFPRVVRILRFPLTSLCLAASFGLASSQAIQCSGADGVCLDGALRADANDAPETAMALVQKQVQAHKAQKTLEAPQHNETLQADGKEAQLQSALSVARAEIADLRAQLAAAKEAGHATVALADKKEAGNETRRRTTKCCHNGAVCAEETDPAIDLLFVSLSSVCTALTAGSSNFDPLSSTLEDCTCASNGFSVETPPDQVAAHLAVDLPEVVRTAVSAAVDAATNVLVTATSSITFYLPPETSAPPPETSAPPQETSAPPAAPVLKASQSAAWARHAPGMAIVLLVASATLS